MDPGRFLLDLHSDNGLPFGYLFHPSDFEILQYYLIPKLKGETPATDFVQDFDVYRYDPKQLPLNESNCAKDDESHFFVPLTRDLLQGDDMLTRTTPNGCWKVFKHSVAIYGPNGVIGYKNKLAYYHGNNKTDWKMNEYWTNFRGNDCLESFMVCRVKLKVEAEGFYEEDYEGESGDENGRLKIMYW